MSSKLLDMKNILFLISFFSFYSYSQNSENLIQNYFKLHTQGTLLEEDDYKDFKIISTSSSLAKETQHLYLGQFVQGLQIFNSQANFTIQNGKIIASNINFEPNTSSKLPVLSPKLSPQQALESILKQLGIQSNSLEITKTENNTTTFSKNNISKEDVPFTLGLMSNGEKLTLVYETNIYLKDASHWYSMKINANTGEIEYLNDWVVNCKFDNADDSQTHQHLNSETLKKTLDKKPKDYTPKALSQYRVFAIPTESPNHGAHVLVSDPHDLIASPFGWHDDNGVVGAEYTITRGNNVYAYEDISDNNTPGNSPSGGAINAYDFGYATSQTTSQNLDAAITNLFYMNNIMHDVWFQYGFDESSGNFQFNNYSNNGIDDDHVMAEAQDGSGTNNANFATPPDGGNPRMQMYIWSSSANSQLLTINSPIGLQGNYTTTYASWSAQITTPITADLALVVDGVGDLQDGCETITNGSQLIGKIAVIRRGACTFIAKAQAAESEGAVGVIIVNNVGGNPVSMGGTGSVSIPVLMVSQNDGEKIIDSLLANKILNGTINGTGNLIANDSDFDNGVIAHEFGHGISNRLTGGANNTNCLSNEDQMGEGWSDWFGLMLTMQPGATATQNRGVGTYLVNQTTNGQGIRPAPYNTNFSVNGYTFASTNNTSISRPHGIGFVWCSMLWDLNWAFIDEYGFDPDVYYGNGGNNMVMKLVIEALKLQPCSPGFVDGRDAILLADQILNGGANACIIWDVFAKRGLGLSADQGDTDNRFDQVEAFDKPVCDISSTASILDNKANLISVYPNPNNGQFYIQSNDFGDISSLKLTDLNGKILFEQSELVTFKTLIDVSSFAKGMYLLNYQFGGKVYVKRVVVE